MEKLIYFLLMCFIGNATAQDMQALKPLKVGENAPNVYLHNIRNHPGQKAHLKDFIKGKKLLIIDFWNRGCSACISQMPKVQELQCQFDADIQIIYALNPRDSAYYKVLAERIPNVRSLKLPSINGDTTLYRSLFPHQGDPYQIWLDADLKILASSSHIHLTASNIQDYLKGDLRNFPGAGKDTFSSSYFNQDHRSLLGLQDGFFAKRMVSYSLFTHSVKELACGTGFFLTDSTSGKKIGLKMVNRTVKGLYDSARFAERMDIEDVIMQTKDSAFHNIDIYAPNAIDYQYCYESNFGDEFNYKSAQRKLLSDLDRQFGLDSRVEEIPTNCLVLSIKDSTKFKGLKSKFKALLDEKGFTIVGPQSYVPLSGKGFVIGGSPISTVTGYLENRYKGRFRMVDEINGGNLGGQIPIDLKLSSQLDDLKSLQKELLRHGISLKEEVRPLKFLVVRDAN